MCFQRTCPFLQGFGSIFVEVKIEIKVSKKYEIFGILGKRMANIRNLENWHLCCIARKTKQKNFKHFPPHIIETGVWSKSSPHKVWCNTVIVLPAFSLLRHRGATERGSCAARLGYVHRRCRSGRPRRKRAGLFLYARA